jgi:hypothetical protein
MTPKILTSNKTNNLCLIITFSILLITSCSIEKRKYRSGFYRPGVHGIKKSTENNSTAFTKKTTSLPKILQDQKKDSSINDGLIAAAEKNLFLFRNKEAYISTPEIDRELITNNSMYRLENRKTRLTATDSVSDKHNLNVEKKKLKQHGIGVVIKITSAFTSFLAYITQLMPFLIICMLFYIFGAYLMISYYRHIEKSIKPNEKVSQVTKRWGKICFKMFLSSVFLAIPYFALNPALFLFPIVNSVVSFKANWPGKKKYMNTLKPEKKFRVRLITSKIFFYILIVLISLTMPLILISVLA